MYTSFHTKSWYKWSTISLFHQTVIRKLHQFIDMYWFDRYTWLTWYLKRIRDICTVRSTSLCFNDRISLQWTTIWLMVVPFYAFRIFCYDKCKGCSINKQDFFSSCLHIRLPLPPPLLNFMLWNIPGVPKKTERLIFLILILKNIAYFDFIR